MADILSAVLAGFAGGGIVTWFAQLVIGERIKAAIRHEYEEKLEAYKSQLQAANSAATERLKADLQIAASERQVRFSRLHEKVAEVVAETYSKLSAVLGALANYVSVYENAEMGPKEKRRDALTSRFSELNDYFYPRRLYLPRRLAESVAQFHKQAAILTGEFFYGVEKPEEESDERVHKWIEINDKLQKEAAPLFNELEDEFRRLLGVETGATALIPPESRSGN